MVEFLTWLNSLTTWLIQNVFVALLVGILTGVTASVVVSRIAKFEELRNEARRIVWGIQGIEKDGQIEFNFKHDPGDLVYISSEFFALKHKNAGELISKLHTDIASVEYSRPSAADMEIFSSRWQKVCRELKPDRQTIYAINWKL